MGVPGIPPRPVGGPRCWAWTFFAAEIRLFCHQVDADTILFSACRWRPWASGCTWGLWAFGCCPRPDPALCTPRGGRSPGPVRRLSLVHPAGPCCGVSSGLWLTRGRQGAWPCGVFYPVCLPAAGTRRLGWDNPTLLAPCHVSGVLPPGVVSRCLSPERGRGGGGGGAGEAEAGPRGDCLCWPSLPSSGLFPGSARTDRCGDVALSWAWA